MSSTVGLIPIPWRFVDSDLMKMWLWEAEHFEAKVTAEMNSFAWEIGDLIASADGVPRFLAEGRTGDFATAEREIREVIGKSYAAKYGYAPYAGDLATTFTIATGERVNFAAWSGQRIVVTVRMPSGADQTFVGYAQVVHYELHLTPDTGTAVRIQPAHIARVVGEGGGNIANAAKASYTGIGRIYRGQVPRGCNGVNGFLPETIDHTAAAPCPVHEDVAPRFSAPISR